MVLIKPNLQVFARIYRGWIKMPADSEMSLPMHQKDLLPKDKMEQGLFISMILGIIFALCWEFLVVVPSYYSSYSDGTVILLAVAAVFIVTNILANMHMVKKIDVSGKQKPVPSILRVGADMSYGGWNFCHACNMNSPPRAYHCHICDECVLKRSHHCKCMGCCVGYHNQRYYIITLFYLWIGVLSGVCFQWAFCFQQMGGARPAAFLALIAPHIAWVFGIVSATGFIVSVIHVLGLLTLMLTSYLLAVQIIAIYTGQTDHEKKAGIKRYNYGWKHNFLDVFGSRWYLIWLSPWIASPQMGDGMNFAPPSQSIIKTM